MSDAVDVCVLSYNRRHFTELCLRELTHRTKYPHRVIVVDNGSTDGTAEWLRGTEASFLADKVILNPENWGVHGGWNLALENVTSAPYFVSMDNDIIPQPGWLSLLIDLMDRHPDYGAICLRAQAFIGQGGNLFEDAPEIKERDHIPAYCRIMRTDVTREMGGWRDTKEPGRNNEDWTVGKRMNKAGYRVGFSRDIYCLHLWDDSDDTDDWGYPPGSDAKHREIWPRVTAYQWDKLGFDWNTCRPRGRE